MKLSIELIATKKCLQSFCHLPMASMVQYLVYGVNQPTMGGAWSKAIDDADSAHVLSNKLLRGLITNSGYFSQPEFDRYIRSGERRRLAMLT